MSYCGICGDDDHGAAACELRLGAPRADQAGLLPQHRRCWTCRDITYAWDHRPCGQHAPVNAQLPRADPPPVTPRRDPAPGLQALALTQAAEARAERGADLDTWWNAMMARERREIRLPALNPGQDESQHDQHHPAQQQNT